MAEKIVSSTSGSVVRFLSGDGSQLALFRLSDEGSGWWVKDAGKQSKAARPTRPPPSASLTWLAVPREV